jgi:hypothetical protein
MNLIVQIGLLFCAVVGALSICVICVTLIQANASVHKILSLLDGIHFEHKKERHDDLKDRGAARQASSIFHKTVADVMKGCRDSIESIRSVVDEHSDHRRDTVEVRAPSVSGTFLLPNVRRRLRGPPDQGHPLAYRRRAPGGRSLSSYHRPARLVPCATERGRAGRRRVVPAAEPAAGAASATDPDRSAAPRANDDRIGGAGDLTHSSGGRASPDGATSRPGDFTLHESRRGARRGGYSFVWSAA